MKRTHIILITGLAVAVLGGCQKLTEDPKGSLTPGTYFKTLSDLDAAVTSIYTQLTSDAAYANINNSTPCFGADDLCADPGLNKLGFRLFDELNGNSDADGRLSNTWEGPWRAIYQANNIIANYEKVQGDPDAIRHSAGQAYFLRAFCYYMLVRTFGGIPAIDKPLDVDARPPRDAVAKVYDLIVSDLKTANEDLPPSWSNKETGKATRYAAQALLAEVYLTMAGWPLNRTENYALAAEASAAVIRDNQYDLLGDYQQVFQTNNTVESIFALQFSVSGNVPQRLYGASCMPIDEIALSGASGWDDYYPEINFYLQAPPCKRTEETFYTTIKLLQPDKTYKLVPWNSPETHAGHPYYKKFRAGVGDGITETANSIINASPSTNKALDIIRFPMVLLNFAEASAMATGTPSADAYNAVNRVRNRAGLPDLPAGLSAVAFRDSVVQERAYEFAGEFGIRWFDIVRLQLLPKVIAARSDLENPIPDATKNNPAVLAQKYLAPIPTNEMQRNPQWTQNPGY